MRYCSLGSGSRGNATLIEYGSTRLLVDCGFSIRATEKRLLNVAQALRDGLSVEDVHQASKIDRWFLRQIAEIVREEGHLRVKGLPTEATPFRRLKAKGFSDARLAKLTGTTEKAVRDLRRPVQHHSQPHLADETRSARQQHVLAGERVADRNASRIRHRNRGSASRPDGPLAGA